MKSKTAEELINLTSSELLFKLDQVRQAAIKLGAQWAEAKADYRAKKELLPIELAVIQRDIFHGEEMPVSQARMEALAYPDYRKLTEAMNKAEKRAHELEVEYKSFYESIKAIAAISFVRNSELKLAR